jgi:integrase
MSKYVSCATDLFERFETYQRASGKWNVTVYELNLKIFDKYCHKEYPYATALTQTMIEGWCAKRATEDSNSNRCRIQVIATCIKYLRARGLCNLTGPTMPQRKASTYIPHAFTDEELKAFFDACDSITVPVSNKVSCLRKIEVPTFFRLLYSSGIRTTEARLLRVEDVNLEDGILDIRESKGHDQHYVVLHDTMSDLMRRYDAAIRKIIPNRVYFFPSHIGGPHSRTWVSDNFKLLWDKGSYERAIPYELRHHYAIYNLNSWVGCGLEFNARFLYLSKSMGHCILECTRYYYTLVPCLADIMLNFTNDSFNEIIPEVDYEDEQAQ